MGDDPFMLRAVYAAGVDRRPRHGVGKRSANVGGKRRREGPQALESIGGADGDRTRDLLTASPCRGISANPCGLLNYRETRTGCGFADGKGLFTYSTYSTFFLLVTPTVPPNFFRSQGYRKGKDSGRADRST